MSKEYQELKEDLLKIATLKDEVIRIDFDSNLAEEEKYAKLAEIALMFCIHTQK